MAFACRMRTLLPTRPNGGADPDEIVPDVLCSGIGTAPERGQEELHRECESAKESQVVSLQTRSAQVICDSPAIAENGR